MELNPLFHDQLIHGALVIHGDNKSGVRTVQEQAISNEARHIALRWYHFMEAIKAKVLEAHCLSGKLNPANLLSKPPESNEGFIKEANDLLHGHCPHGQVISQRQTLYMGVTNFFGTQLTSTIAKDARCLV